MNRLFSMIRRRPNYVDLVIPRLEGVDGYRIAKGSNFDASFTTMFTATVNGFADPAINPMVIDSQNLGVGPYGPPVRVVFDPVTYGLTDTSSFWLQFIPVTGGAPGTAGAPTLCLPSSANHGLGIVTIRGTAPNQASSAASLQIDLPRLSQDFRVHNEEGATNLFIATEQSGAEVQCKPGAQEQMTALLGTQGSIWVRGGGATAVFSMTFTTAFPR